jgi:hypothetical protein
MTDFDFDREGDELHARSSDPETSHDSMKAYDKDRLRGAQQCVVDLHQRHGELALFELEVLFAQEWQELCSPHLFRQARRSAADKGLLHKTGETKLNPTTNRQQEVWKYGEGPPVVLCYCPYCGGLVRRDKVQEQEED